MENKEPECKVQYEDGSWSKWGTLNEIIKSNEMYISVIIRELITEEEYENYGKDSNSI